jgi:hypothetical protein
MLREGERQQDHDGHQRNGLLLHFPRAVASCVKKGPSTYHLHLWYGCMSCCNMRMGKNENDRRRLCLRENHRRVWTMESKNRAFDHVNWHENGRHFAKRDFTLNFTYIELFLILQPLANYPMNP